MTWPWAIFFLGLFAFLAWALWMAKIIYEEHSREEWRHDQAQQRVSEVANDIVRRMTLPNGPLYEAMQQFGEKLARGMGGKP